jgi:hypothetical protein
MSDARPSDPRPTPDPLAAAPAHARPVAFGLRTAALAGMLIASTALPGATPATGLAGVFTGDATVLACPPFPTCCGTVDA